MGKLVKSASLLVVALVVPLTACVQGPDYTRPRPTANGAVARGGFVRSGEGQEIGAPVAAEWWRALDDPRLDGLIEKGLRSAPSQVAAIARVRQARSRVGSARRGQLPAISASGTYINADLPADSLGGGDRISGELFNLGLDASWEIDLWGAGQRKIERAKAEAEVEQARLADARVTLSAEIARTYFALLGRKCDADLLNKRQKIEQGLASDAATRFRAGVTGRQPVEAAEAQLDRTVGEIATARADINVLADTLAVLTGQEPGALNVIVSQPVENGEIPLPPSVVAIGDPASLIERRPDVRAAERALAAANAQIGVAKAARFPSVSFLGLVGIGGNTPGDVLDPDQITSIAVPRITWSFLDFGRTERGIEQAQYARDVAAAGYDEAVLRALQDVEAALARYGQRRIVFGKALAAERRLDTMATLDEHRAQAGTISQSNAFGSRKAAIEAGRAAVSARADLSAAYATLAKALGLGWQDSAESTGINSLDARLQ